VAKEVKSEQKGGKKIMPGGKEPARVVRITEGKRVYQESAEIYGKRDPKETTAGKGAIGVLVTT